MEKLKKIIEGKSRWGGLNEQIELIEKNKESNTNIALDSAKTILESICKTILTDKGIEYKHDINFHALVKQCFQSLPVFGKLEKNDLETTKSLLSSLANISQCIGTFRNTHGFFSHGQDLEGKNFDIYLTNLVIESSDLLSSFALISHSESFANRERIIYEECEVFNAWFDIDQDWVEVKGVPCSPSLTLFSSDKTAYKEELMEYYNNPESQITALENNEEKSEEIINTIISTKSIFSENQLRKLATVLEESKSLNANIFIKLKESGIFESLENVQENIKKMSESIDESFAPIRKSIEQIGESIPNSAKRKSSKTMGE